MKMGYVFEKRWCSSKQIMCPFATIYGFCRFTACVNHDREEELAEREEELAERKEEGEK